MEASPAWVVLALVAAAVLVFAGCDGRAAEIPVPESTATPTFTPTATSATATPTPEHYVRLLVVSDGAHDSLILEWIGGPPNPTKWQYRRGVWRRGSDGQGYWRRDDDGGRVWTIEWGAWTDIPSSGASTRSFRDTGLQPSTLWNYQVRAVVGTVAGDGSGVEQGRTQEQGRQFLDIYASDVVEGDGQRRWLVLDFTIVIPDGVRVSASGADPYGVDSMARDQREWASLSVWGVDSIIYGVGGERLGNLDLGRDGKVLHRYMPLAQARSGATALDQIIASISKYP